MTRMILRVILSALAASTAVADTVTTRDSSSWNGSVTIAGGVLSLNATFKTGKLTLRFGANYVRSVAFNAAAYNPGADPSKLIPKTTGEPFRGTIYMLNKTNKQCADVTVQSAGQVFCDGEKAPDVVRILITPR
jgi:hypothetical protein